MSEERQGRSGWAIVEVMGHVTIAGYVTETTLAGAGVLAVAVPDGDRTIEQLISPTSLYRLTWVGEAEARQVARKHPVQVIDEWTIRQEVRERIEATERERIEQRIMVDAKREYQIQAGEERRRVLDILSDAKSIAQTAVKALPEGSIEIGVANRLMADIATWCEESHERLRGEQPSARTYAGGGYDDDGHYSGDDEDEEPDI